MRLLKKSEVLSEVNFQKKEQIDSGMEIAKKIDALREVYAQEENKVKQFRSETIKKIQSEIDEKIGEKTLLENEIKQLYTERENLKKPLDEEWEKVKEKGKEVEQKSIYFSSVELDLIDRDSQLKEKENEISKIHNSNIQEKELIAQERREVEETKKQAEEEYRKASIERARYEDRKEKLEKDFRQKELGLDYEKEAYKKAESDFREKERKLDILITKYNRLLWQK